MNGHESGVQTNISVCVPAYMAEPFIAAAIESVLAQTYQHWELIILDNNSSDRTGDIARSYGDPRIKVHTNPTTLDLADNWNAVTKLATAPYIKLLCADDVLDSECLAVQIEILEADPDLAIVASKRDFLDVSGDVVLEDRGLTGLIGRHEADVVVDQVVRSGINPIGWPSVMLFRREDFLHTGGFDSRWQYPMDLELSLRLLEHGAFYGIDHALASFRISPTSATSTISHHGAQHRSMLREVAGRRRWRIGRYSLARGLFLSHVESVRRRLFFAAVNSGFRPLRKLPGLVLSRRWWPFRG